jgi:hypothetical protein
MSCEDEKKCVLTQRLDDSAQGAVDGPVYIKQRVFPKHRAECSPVLRVSGIVGGP